MFLYCGNNYYCLVGNGVYIMIGVLYFQAILSTLLLFCYI